MLRAIAASILLVCSLGCATPGGGTATPLQLSLFPPAQLAPEGWNVAGLRVCFVYGRNLNLTGLDLGLANEVAQDAVGMQVAGLWNSAGRAAGAQIGGVMNFANEMSGLQVVGIGINKADIATGLQLAPFGNLATTDMNGMQVALVGNTAGTQTGAQIALINASDETHGAQIGPIYNDASRLHGVQIGIVNCCRKATGLQIGLLNFDLDGPLPFLPLIYPHF